MKKRKISTWIVRIVLWLLISLIIGGTIYSFNAKRVLGEEMPMPFGIGTSIVLSGSMEPALLVDDLAVIKKCKNYNVNDIVVYRSNNSYVIHRIVQIDGDTVITQGDANNTADTPISMSAIKGKMIFSIPNAAKAINFIRQPIVIIIIITAAILLLEFSGDREKKKDEADKGKLKKEIQQLKEKSISK